MDLLLREPGPVGSSGTYAFLGQGWVIPDDLVRGKPGSKSIKDHRHEDARALDARLTMTDRGIDGDEIEKVGGSHPCSVTVTRVDVHGCF